ncbi:MAG: plasmid pRiA4b ORF-3 family protein [Marinilabilia sp.]
MPHIYQVTVTLDGIFPPIWRRLLIPSDLFLHDFHKVLQTAMGWENQHMHVFLKGERMFGPSDDEWSQTPRFQDYIPVRVNDLLRRSGDQLVYQYDMGDNWRHSVVLEKEVEPDTSAYYPVCIDGARECPPEDCGGPEGYREMIAAVKDPSSPHHRFFKALFPEGLDPEYFDKEMINDFLMEENYGCLLPFDEED